MRFTFFAFLFIGLAFSVGCDRRGDVAEPVPQQVVVYTALDQFFSEPILEKFQADTGIAVRAVYDSEASKTVGLVNRLIAEKARPQADVFWNNEIVRTIQLKKMGVLASYESPQAEGIPETFRDPEHFWTGFAARARVLVYNTRLTDAEDVARDLTDLAVAREGVECSMAYPLFGTTSTHAAVLYELWGPEKAERFFRDLKASPVRIVDGNMTACRAVATGEVPFGLTDTDDANLVKDEGAAIDFHMIDHEGEGALLIPNTVALIEGAPHPDAARKLIDFLLSAEVEAMLAASPSAQIPLRAGVEAPEDVERMAQGKFLKVDFEAATEFLVPSAEFLSELFSQP